MNELWFRPFAWMDFRLAVLFAVVIPLILLIWAFVQKASAMQHLLAIYWRVASLLGITIYLMSAQSPISFITAPIARVLIAIALWFWIDLNEEIDDQPASPLKLTFSAWRWATTVYCLVSAIAYLPFLSCAFSTTAIKTPYCQAAIEPLLVFKQYVHPNSTPAFLGFLAIVGLIIYVLYLSYFVLFKLGKYGRSAIQQ